MTIKTYRCFEIWDYSDNSLLQFVEDILTNEYDRIIIYAQNEWDWAHRFKMMEEYSFADIISKLQEKNKQVDVIVTGRTINKSIVYPGFNVYEWDNWFYIQVVLQSHLMQSYKLESYKAMLFKHDFSYNYVSLNHRAHNHRCMLIDLLAKHSLIERGAITWHDNYHGGHCNYNWEFFNPRIMALSNNFDDKWQNPPNEYHDSFIQLISESTLLSIISSEKTVMPIIHFKPFIVAGPKDFYKVMDELGFKRYTELFDYAFDDETNDKIRTEMVVKNIKKNAYLTAKEMVELHFELGPKLLYNFNNMLKIALDFDNWHPLAKECVDHYKQTGEMLNKNVIGAYMHLSASGIKSKYE